jgi:hypothetical protein
MHSGPNCCIDKTLISFYNKFELQTTSMRNLAQMAQRKYILRVDA